MSEPLKTKLTREEGREYKAYGDPLTHAEPYTIGIGHTGREVHLGLTWDDNQIDFAYELDEADAWTGCYENFGPWFTTLNDARQGALVMMVFQMGIERVRGFVQALDAIRDQHFEHAAVCMLDSDWARQTVGRAGRMSRQIATGEWQ